MISSRVATLHFPYLTLIFILLAYIFCSWHIRSKVSAHFPYIRTTFYSIYSTHFYILRNSILWPWHLKIWGDYLLSVYEIGIIRKLSILRSFWCEKKIIEIEVFDILIN